MANLSILSGIEFYSYDVEVYDKVLLGIIRYKESQVTKFKKIDKTFFENKSFYGINRIELVEEFIKYLSKYDSKIDKDSFLLGDVVDKRIKKGATYINDTMIFMASPKQYDAQAMAKAKEEALQKVKVQQAPKEVLKLDMEYKDKIYKVKLDLDALGIGAGTKVLYDFNEAMLKSKVESFLKSYKKEYNVQLSLQEEFVQVGKLLIDVIVYNDHVEGFIDLSSLNLDGIPSIKAEGKDKQELLNNIIQQLKAHKLTGKLNWGTVTDKTIKKGDTKVAKTVEMKDLKALVKNISTMVKKVGMNEKEIDGRIYSIIPNASDLGVGNLGGENINLAYVLPWKFDKEKVKKKKFAEEVAETHPSNVVIKEVDLTLYIIDDNGPDDIRISIDADVKWVNTFFGSLEQDSYVLVENYVKVEVEQEVTGNLLLQEFIEKIASRPNVRLAVKIDKYTPFPVSFDVDEGGFEQVSVRFENNATKFRASFRLSGPFSELQSKTYSFCHYLDTIGFDVSQEGLGAVVRGEYDNGDISIINDLVTLLDKIKAFSYNHANSFETWAKKHKYGYTEAKAFFQVRNIIPNYDGDAIVYKSGKSNYIAIPNDVEGIDGFISAVKHAYTPEKSGASYRFYFPNLEEMQKFVEFANKIDKPVADPFGLNEPTSDQIDDDFGKPGQKPVKKTKGNPILLAFKDRILSMKEVTPTVQVDKDTKSPVSFSVNFKGYRQFDVNFFETSEKIEFKAIILPDVPWQELEVTVKTLCNAYQALGFNAKVEGTGIAVSYEGNQGNTMIIARLVNVLNIARDYANSKINVKVNNVEAQDLGGVKPNNDPFGLNEPTSDQIDDEVADQIEDDFGKPGQKPVKNMKTVAKGIARYVVEKGEKTIEKVPFAKGQKYQVVEYIQGLGSEPDSENIFDIEVLSVFKNGKVRCKNLTLGYEYKIGLEATNKRKMFVLIEDVEKEVVKKAKDLSTEKDVPKPVAGEVEEPANREVERTFKASKVKDPAHKEQLERMRNYVKKIADVVDADNDFALRFLEEPKEFQKYKLPTVGLGLFYYGDKSATELEQNALYKKVYRGRGLSILRKFFKTTDLNGEKCLLVLFVDAQYAKETKAKLIKESFELGNKVRINGRLYKVNAIYEHKFAIETIVGLMYIDMDSDLIDITIEED